MRMALAHIFIILKQLTKTKDKMAKVSKLDMAQAVLNHSNITTQKSLLGEKVIYTPTGSKVKAYQREYTSSDGQLAQRILAAPEAKMEPLVAKARGVIKAAIGSTRIDMCISADRQFAAFQVFKFLNLTYQRDSDVRIFEGYTANLLADLFLNGK